jgi:hypothetical protein
MCGTFRHRGKAKRAVGNEFNILYSGCRHWRFEVIAVKYAVWLLEYLLYMGSMKYLFASELIVIVGIITAIRLLPGMAWRHM